MTRIKSSTDAFAAAAAAVSHRYELCLFIAGMTPLSSRALENLKAICEAEIPGNYDLKVVDVYQEPDRAKAEQVVAAPTLVKRGPGRRRILVGDLSDHAAVIRGLDLPEKAAPPKNKKKTAKKVKREKGR